MTDVNQERLEFTLTLAPPMASAFLESLNHRLAELHAQATKETDPQAIAASSKERDAVVAVMMAWEKAIKSPSATRGIESLFGASKLSALRRAETEAHEALTRAMENLAEAHTAFATALSATGEGDTAAASEMVGASEAELDLAKSAYNEAAGRVRQAKGREAEEARLSAYHKKPMTKQSRLCINTSHWRSNC